MGKIKGYQVFFTVMEENNFVPSNICCGMTNYITEAVKFKFLDGAKRFMKNLNKKRDFRLVRVKYEVKYEVEEVEE